MSVEITPRFFRPDNDSFFTRLFSRLDWSLLAAVLGLALLGSVFIYSATFQGGHPSAYLARQGTALVIGLVGMILLTLLPYQIFQTYARGVYVAGLCLLLLTLAFGTKLRGSRSWINLYFFYFQPVELARLSLAVALAAYADLRGREIQFWQGVLTPLFLAGVHVALILLQPDLSSALVIAPMTLSLLFAAGAPAAFLSALVVWGAIALGIPLASTYFDIVGDRFEGRPVLEWLQRSFLHSWPFAQFWGGVCLLLCFLWWFFRRWRVMIPGVYLAAALGVVVSGVGGSFVVEKALKTYQRKRLIAFLDPAVDPLGSGYNILQSKIAIGSGRFFGKGFLSGSQAQLGFLPEKHTDFIFSLIGEEWGFTGALMVLAIFFWLGWRAFDIATTSRDKFGRYLACALGAFFAFSGLINIGMVMGLMPVTGVPLPFLSYGGSGLVGSFLAAGLLLSIHLRRYIL